MGTECPNGCGEYSNLGKHWSQSHSCSHPSLSNYQKTVIEGILMGDGTINKQSDDWNGRLVLSVVSEDFVDMAKEDLSWLSNRKTVVEKNGKSKNNQNRLVTFCHPEITDTYERWYPNGEKRFPDDLELNSTNLTYWYLGDGSLSFTGAGTPYARIRCNSEVHRDDYLKELFNSIGIDIYVSSNEIRVSTKDTPKFLNMTTSVEDLSYKWETDEDKYFQMDRPYYKGISSP